MNKKVILGIVGLATVAGVSGLVASTTYARGNGGTQVRGMMGSATSTSVMAAQRDVMATQHEAMDKAIEAGDYTAWKAAADTIEAGRIVRPAINGVERQVKPMSSVITEANFAKFVEMHTLMNQADVIRKEIGLDEVGGMGPGMHKGGMGRGQDMRGHRFATSTAVTK